MFSARNARIRTGVNAAGVFVGVSWNVRERNQSFDTTNFESGGYSTRQSTIWDVEVTAAGYWNEALNPHLPPTSFVAGATIPGLWLFLDAVNAPALSWSFPSFYVESVETDSVVRDGMKFKFMGYNNGPFLRPGELVARVPPATT